MDTRSKILSRERATAVLTPLGSNSSGLVVAKGWYDLLLAESCWGLAEAKKKGGTLVAAVYADRQPERRLLEASSRAQMVAAVAAVDYVIICDEGEVESLASSWRAEIIDAERWTKSDVVADVLQRYQSGKGAV